MRYLGGKKRLAKRITAILDAERSDGQPFVDVFCGSLAISAAMPNRGPHIANDACVPLINMYRAWREGWRPPEHVSEELYAELKTKQDPDDPLTAFAGFGCSFGGKWFGGYARGWVKPGTLTDVRKSYPGAVPYDLTARAARLTVDRLSCIGEYNMRIECKVFGAVRFPSRALVYCDPEYRGTTSYSYFKSFDHDLFEDTAQRWADDGATVFVSEYAKQRETWEQVAEWTTSKNIAKKPRTEKLFRVRPA